MGLKFLVVDDSKAMQTIVQRVLANAGYQDHDFKFASNGKQALNEIMSWRPDMVLLDWHMPEMTGIEVIEKVKELELGTRIGFITAEKNENSIRRAKEAGAMFVINKPFTVEKIKENLMPALAGVSTLGDALPNVKEIIFPSATAVSTLLSTITGYRVKVEKISPKPISQYTLPCTLALYGDTEKNIKAVQLLDAQASDRLAELFANSVYKGEPFDDKLLAKSLMKALSILAVCFYSVDGEQALRLLKSYNMPQVIAKVAKMDKVSADERIDLKITFEDGTSCYSLICREQLG